MDRYGKINLLDCLIDFNKIEPKQLKPLYIECNTIDIELETPIYRIISYERLKETLKTQSLSMSKPKTWPDPYETFLMNNKARTKDGAIVSFEEIRDRIYCQCWSLREECEGLWKTHAKNAKDEYKYVKIKSNANKLMEYLYDTNNIFHYLSYFIGRVKYFEEDFFEDLIKDGVGQYFNSIMSSYMAIIHSLLIKRKAFEYEDEVRLIFNVSEKEDVDHSAVINNWDLTSDYFTYKIDINNVIEEITFHPYLDEGEYLIYEQEIKALGYKGEINHSNLYTKEYKIINY